MIPRHTRHGTSLAPNQIFSAGFRDGMNHRVPHAEFQDNLHYLKGYAEGCCSSPASPTLIAFCQMPSLDSALQSIQHWEQDRERFGFGTVALGYRHSLWIVLVSKDLHDIALPF
ncbi:hypothetical protein JOY44_26060 (plasmid) [Phormidium sp. CLA17]|uniref:hypothetical protein n=1 Tax=Leptolyngbya sp. Cla-17 TaxID=2803751 RepID=UPI001493106A|nr:hypothetical protein [Leptolyngbya sp. Cla-17]MBM0744987.1 hypothetical protein [Leptolyngbya sp. Cla-17]